LTPDASSAHLARYEAYLDIIFQISCFGGPSPASVGIRQHIGRVPGHVPHTVRPLTTGTKQCSTDRIRNRTPGSSGQSPGVAIPGLRRPRWPVARLPPRLRPTCARTSTAPGVSVVRDAQFVVHVARLGGTSHRAGAASSKRPAFVKFSPKCFFLRKRVASGEPNFKHVNSDGPAVNGFPGKRMRFRSEQNPNFSRALA
jgi:hypothetical protein